MLIRIVSDIMVTNSKSSVVEEVRVFLYGAEITRRMVVDAKKGGNTATFEGLPENIRPESVNASVENGGKLVSVDYQIDNTAGPKKSKEISELKKRLDKVNDSIKVEKNKLRELRSEERFLESNSKIGGKDGLKLDDLKEIEAYQIERRSAINASKISIEDKLEDLNEEKDRIVRDLGKFSLDNVTSSGRIDVEFASDSEAKVNIRVSYFIDNARWYPYHEIRMKEIDAPVLLSMKGKIIQTTGEDWNNVKVRLSTGNPMLGNDQPILYPWYIDIRMPEKRMVTLVSSDMRLQSKSMPAEAESEEMYMDMRAASVAQVQEAQTTVEFVLPASIDVPSTTKPTKVEISDHVLDAEFYYYCVSKLDTDAFLIAKIEGWESLNILAGEVSIFQENDYVGKTHIDPSVMDDNMEISLGRDKGIIVTRERGKNLTSKGFIGKNKKVVREWMITIRNTRSKDITLKLLDQLPIPTNSSITVEPLEVSGAERDEQTGQLTWTLNIPAGGSEKKTIRYEVSYPKNATVHLD